jgi:hypothetical protein
MLSLRYWGIARETSLNARDGYLHATRTLDFVQVGQCRFSRVHLTLY